MNPKSAVAQRNKANAFTKLAEELSQIGRGLHTRRWVLGTSGNFSAVVRREPLRLAITATGVDKEFLSAEQILEVDQNSSVIRGDGKPSAETLLHVAVARETGAGAVLHTHSTWSTILSDRHAAKSGIAIEGYEILKGLAGIVTHAHREWVPIIENSQDMDELSRAVSALLRGNPDVHGFLIRRHGLYTWGADLQEAKRHVEILEFLMEVVGRA